jgi:hypothetical protein
MDDVAELTKEFRRVLEQTAEMLKRQREINAKLDAVIGALSEALATCDDVQIIEEVPEIERIQ